MERLPDQRPRPAQDHDARRRRVHPPLSPARPAERLPPHPPLRPHRRRGSSAQHRARSPIAHRGHAAARERARRGRQRDRNTSDRPPMPMLRRPDDHNRYVRGRAPCAIAIANPDQNRHLMTVAAHLASQPRSLSLSRAPEHKSADLVTSEDPLRPLRQRQTRTCSRPKRLVFVAGPVTSARRRAARRRMRSAGDLEIPIGRTPPNSAPSPRFPPCEAFEPRPPAARPTVVQGASMQNPRAFRPVAESAFELSLGLRTARRAFPGIRSILQQLDPQGEQISAARAASPRLLPHRGAITLWRGRRTNVVSAIPRQNMADRITRLQIRVLGRRWRG